MFKVCEDVRQHQSRIQEFQNRGRGLDAVKFLGLGIVLMPPHIYPMIFLDPPLSTKLKSESRLKFLNHIQRNSLFRVMKLLN